MSIDERRTARVTSSKVTPKRWSAASDTSIEISYGRIAEIATLEMPGSAASSSRSSCPSSVNVRSSASPWSAMSITARLHTISLTIGFSVSSGRFRTPFTRELSSVSARDMS